MTMTRERKFKHIAIVERAEKEGVYNGDRLSLLMDIESADITFNLRLDDWLNADASILHTIYLVL